MNTAVKTRARPKKPDEAPRPDPAVRARAAAAALGKQDQEFLDGLMRPRPAKWWHWIGRLFSNARAKLSRAEFEATCDEIRVYLDGQYLDPAAARNRAKKLFEAYTDVECRASCPTCDETWLAILIVEVRGWTGVMFYSRSLQLNDPKARVKK